MNEFAQYQPESWLIDGLLVNKKNMFAVRSTFKKIKSSVKKSGVAIAFSASVLLANLPVTGLASPSNDVLKNIGGGTTDAALAAFSGETSSPNLVNLHADPTEDETKFGEFLSFIDHQIEHHPELLVPANKAQLQRINDLLTDLQ